MSNSPLATYSNISPSRNSPRRHKIDTVTIHCTAGQMTAKNVIDYLARPNVQASCNYAVGYDGSIAMGVEERDRSWCSSSGSNDHRAITIEVSSESSHPYKVTDKALQSLIDLLVDICKRNGIPELRWRNDSNLIGQTEKQNMTLHRWFANKACPGQYLIDKHPEIVRKVNARLRTEKFKDVFPEDWFYDSVQWALEKGITSGTSESTFSPDAPCTRAEAVMMLWRLAGSPEPSGIYHPFADVSPTDWHAKAVQFALEKDITAGIDESHFGPDEVCNRAQMVTFLWRYYGSEATPGKRFSDVSADDYFAIAVQWASANDITAGTEPEKFSPDEHCTRAQAVTMIRRAREAHLRRERE